jgi:hypothetical protein
MVAVRVQCAENEEVQEALAELVRLLARQAAKEHHAQTPNSRGDEGVKQ